MQKTIDQITDHLVSLVTSDKPHYNPKELLKAGIPSFIVERVRMHLEDKVREDLGRSESPWFDAGSRFVQEAWIDYVRSAISTSHIPKSDLYEILNTVVRDIIYVFIEPRKNMAEYIFREEEELSYDELELRCARLTIYKHFGTAIPLYMKKRDLEKLSKERCKLLIEKLDSKLVASYTAQDWAQKLEQLFVLFGGKVEPKLLATFFKDKGLDNLARRFENRRKLLTKTDFIYVISTEDLDDFSVEKSTDQKKDRKAKDSKAGGRKEQNKENNLIESFFGDYSPTDSAEGGTLADQYFEGSLTDEEMNELLADIASDGVIEVEHSEQVESLNELFSLGKEELEASESEVSETTEQLAEQIKNRSQDDEENVKEFRENLVSILDQARSSYKGISGEDETEDEEPDDSLASVFKDEVSDEQDDDDEAADDIFIDEDEQDEGADEDQPMWAQFLKPDQMDVLMGGERSNARKQNLSESSEEEGIEVEDDELLLEDETVFEKPEANSYPAANDKEAEIRRLLEDREDEFVEVIFSGSESRFIDAVRRIETFESWRETSDFIKDEIFAKNDVDLLSGATVDFTDRLHQYFNESANR